MTNINEKLQETIAQMQAKIHEIEDIATKNQQLASPYNAKRIEEIKNNTVNTIKEAIVRLEDLVEHEQDEHYLETLFSKIIAKTKEATQYTIQKINDIKNNTDLHTALHDLKQQAQGIYTDPKVQGFVDSLKKETVKVYHDINNYLKSEKTQANIKKAKVKTVELAQKGVNALDRFLNGKDTTNE
ncbi:MAG: hypothetical protein Q4D47_05395 [Erysipelotrichaceae bacterium]|nr:hypothetical protein [Erysipelotrichaceae bacterium]